VTNLKVIMFKSFYVWMVAYNYFVFLIFLEFLDVYFFIIECFSCILLEYLDCTPLCFFMRFNYLLDWKMIVHPYRRLGSERACVP
jgi:hypothetical protein